MCHISPLSMVFSFCMNVSLPWLPVCFCEHFAVLSLLTLPFPIMAIEGNNMRLLDAIEATEHLTLIDLHLHLHIHEKSLHPYNTITITTIQIHVCKCFCACIRNVYCKCIVSMHMISYHDLYFFSEQGQPMPTQPHLWISSKCAFFC